MFKKILLLLCFSVWATASLSAPLTWTLNGVTLVDGGIATGSFVFDADTNTVSDWNINVSGGNTSLFPAFAFSPISAPNSSGVPNSFSGTTVEFLIDNFALGGTPESRLIRLVTGAPLTNAGGSVALINPPLFGSVECYNCSPFRSIVSGTLNAPLPASPPVCDIQLNQSSYVNGDTVSANVFRFANLSSTDIATEIKIWLGLPGIAPISVTNAGADGSVVLPVGTDIDFGPLPLFPVAGLPLGSYELSCRMLDPVTGELLAEDRNLFNLTTPTPPLPKPEAPGDLVITEVMIDPLGIPDTAGEWFEIYNPAGTALELQGLVISDDGVDSFQIDSSLIIPAGGFVVLGANGDPAQNGGVNLDFQYSNFILVNAGDEIEISNGPVVIDRIVYSSNFGLFPGQAASLDALGNWCAAVNPLAPGNFGTPGAPNPDCF